MFRHQFREGPQPLSEDSACLPAQRPQHKHQRAADANDYIDPRSVNQTSALAAQPIRTHTSPLYQSVCLQKQFQHINSVLLCRPDVAMRADRCSYIPSVDTLFVSPRRVWGEFTRLWLLSQSRTNLLVRRLETNMKIKEKPRILYVDFEGVAELQNIWQPN